MKNQKKHFKKFTILIGIFLLTACSTPPPPKPEPEPITLQEYTVTLTQNKTKAKDLQDLYQNIGLNPYVKSQLSPEDWVFNFSPTAPVLLTVNYKGEDGIEYIYNFGYMQRDRELRISFSNFRAGGAIYALYIQ